MTSTTKKILLVEDDSILRETYQHFFEKSGYIVYLASSGPDAVSFSENEAFDIILLDIIIPGFDGFHVLSKLKENPKTAHIPVVMMTNLDDDKFLQRAMKLGATEYLIKATTTPQTTVAHVKEIIG